LIGNPHVARGVRGAVIAGVAVAGNEEVASAVGSIIRLARLRRAAEQSRRSAMKSAPNMERVSIGQGDEKVD
jgi:hypothetical protein